MKLQVLLIALGLSSLGSADVTIPSPVTIEHTEVKGAIDFGWQADGTPVPRHLIIADPMATDSSNQCFQRLRSLSTSVEFQQNLQLLAKKLGFDDTKKLNLNFRYHCKRKTDDGIHFYCEKQHLVMMLTHETESRPIKQMSTALYYKNYLRDPNYTFFSDLVETPIAFSSLPLSDDNGDCDVDEVKTKISEMQLFDLEKQDREVHLEGVAGVPWMSPQGSRWPLQSPPADGQAAVVPFEVPASSE